MWSHGASTSNNPYWLSDLHLKFTNWYLSTLLDTEFIIVKIIEHDNCVFFPTLKIHLIDINRHKKTLKIVVGYELATPWSLVFYLYHYSTETLLIGGHWNTFNSLQNCLSRSKKNTIISSQKIYPLLLDFIPFSWHSCYTRKVNCLSVRKLHLCSP